MKKFLISLTLAATAVAVSAFTAPEALYMVGTMNSWTVPADGGTQYTLTDADGDGIYTGEFNIPAGNLEFKVFSALSGWGNQDDYQGSFKNLNDPYSLFNTPTTIPLATVPNGGQYNVVIANWKGGKMSVEASLIPNSNDGFNISITLTTPEQPERPDTPDKIYLVGAFNDWKKPDASSANGAIILTAPSNAEMGNTTYTGEGEIPAGKAKFKIYYDEPSTGNQCFLGSTVGKFALTREEESEPAITVVQYNSEGSDTEIMNWTGGKLKVTYNYNYARTGSAELEWDKAPLNDFPKQIYVISKTYDDRYEVFGPYDDPAYDQSYIYCSVIAENTRSICISSSATVPPSPEDVWGPYEPLPQEYYLPNIYFEKNGNWIEYPENKQVSISLFINRLDHLVDVVSNITDPLPKEMYIVGTLNGFKEPSIIFEDFYKDYALKEYEEGIFSGTFVMGDKFQSDGSVQFRLFGDLGGWSSRNQIGALYEDFSGLPIYIAAEPYVGGVYFPGQGNWILADITSPTDVTVTYNANTETIRIERDKDGVTDVEADSAVPTRWYNLQGQPVDNPDHGVFIKAKGRQVTKVMIP